ncbi:MAG: hypothetical protein K0Q57_415 [Gammaproteobacteria bacterium]|nr:hypothetical protein [Gammaproteobacteria bacterium]
MQRPVLFITLIEWRVKTGSRKQIDYRLKLFRIEYTDISFASILQCRI